MIRYKKYFLILLMASFGLLALITWSSISPSSRDIHVEKYSTEEFIFPGTNESSKKGESNCNRIEKTSGDISTVQILPKLKFDPEWMEEKEYWNIRFEKRYQERRELWSKLPLKVFIVPHSHNDPGWLKTVETYFASSTNKILNFAVDKLSKYKNMTFIWTEISFLSMWWSTATPSRRAQLKTLLSEGRFEIPTGGWVMTDEANPSIYAMVDQLIEGHIWTKGTLNYTPSTSWSVDPFGHGSTFPYVLKRSGIDAMMIMRIHYAWKEWFAKNQNGDFIWNQSWSKTDGILCHNFPYDIYSIKGSCGPHSSVCLEYNFRKIPGEYNEYSSKYSPVNSHNVQERAERLLEQYGKTGSLFPHNVVLVPLGDDFTYNEEVEWDQQYSNYQRIINYINSNFENCFAEIRFGTPSDYFKAIRSRMNEYQSLTGDFFVYSDVFSEGRPAYWSGYYTTRPRLKQMARRLESVLRTSEILFTLAYNSARQTANDFYIESLQATYGSELVKARRNLALFQHHDAITGTSKAYVMSDYENKLMQGFTCSQNVLSETLNYFLKTRNVYSRLNEDFPKIGTFDKHDLLLINSLGTSRYEFLKVIRKKNAQNGFQIYDLDHKQQLDYQISPIFDQNDLGFDKNYIEISFFAYLEPMSMKRIRIVESPTRIKSTKIYSNNHNYTQHDEPSWTFLNLPEGDISLENSIYQLIFNSEGKFLNSIKHKPTGKSDNVEIYFGKYSTLQFRSGAYLFKPGEVLDMFDTLEIPSTVDIISGSIYSQLTLSFKIPIRDGSSFMENAPNSESRPGIFRHIVRLYHAKNEALTHGIVIENAFDLGGSLLNRDIDLFMRFSSKSIDNGRSPILYTDSAGFQMMKRSKVEEIGIEGNYWPITSSAFIEDEEIRLTLLVEHAMGASAWETGQLEVMVDRRSSYDDSRGMGEGVLDSTFTRHQYWLLFEPKMSDYTSEFVEEVLLSPLATVLSNQLKHSVDILMEKSGREWNLSDDKKLPSNFINIPANVHFFNLRTLPLPNTTPDNIPSSNALLILHKQASSCNFYYEKKEASKDFNRFNPLRVNKIVQTSLTGIKDISEVVNLEEVYHRRLLPMSLNTFRVEF